MTQEDVDKLVSQCCLVGITLNNLGQDVTDSHYPLEYCLAKVKLREDSFTWAPIWPESQHDIHTVKFAYYEVDNKQDFYFYTDKKELMAGIYLLSRASRADEREILYSWDRWQQYLKNEKHAETFESFIESDFGDEL